MLITMDNLQTLKIAKERLSEAEKLIGVAIEKGKLTSIDRDLVLEKIRRIYDDLIFEHKNEMQIPETPKISAHKEVEKHHEKVEPVKHQEVEKPKEAPFVPKVEVKIEEPKVLKVEPKVELKIEEPKVFKIEPKVEVSQPPPIAIGAQSQGEILADKFKDTRKFRNESIGTAKKDVASKMQNKAITDLTKSIGINDKFLYTKELFGGNAELYKNTIKVLNEFSDINDALIYVQENFHWDENNEAASQLLELVRRKLLAY